MDTLSVFDTVKILVPSHVWGISLVTLLGGLFALEQWFASTKMVKANSTLQFITGLIKGVLEHVKLLKSQVAPPPADKPVDPPAEAPKQ